jgi:hypothetical protein
VPSLENVAILDPVSTEKVRSAASGSETSFQAGLLASLLDDNLVSSVIATRFWVGGTERFWLSKSVLLCALVFSAEVVFTGKAVLEKSMMRHDQNAPCLPCFPRVSSVDNSFSSY